MLCRLVANSSRTVEALSLSCCSISATLRPCIELRDMRRSLRSSSTASELELLATAVAAAAVVAAAAETLSVGAGAAAAGA
jgi:hypothetical protein